MCKTTVEQVINILETFEPEHCISISEVGEKKCLEVWEPTTGKTIDYVHLPES